MKTNILAEDAPIYNVKILVMFKDYMKNSLHWKKRKIEKVFNRVGVDLSYLEDEQNWFDQSMADSFNDVMVDETSDPDISYKVGSYFSHQSSKMLSIYLLKSFLIPKMVFKRMQQSAAQYSKGSYYEVMEVKANSAVIRSIVNEGCHEKLYQCRNRSGIIKEIPVLFGSHPANVNETECYHKNGRFCEYHIDWKAPEKTRLYLESLVVFILSFMLIFTFGFHFFNVEQLNHPVLYLVSSLFGGLSSIIYRLMTKVKDNAEYYGAQNDILNSTIMESERRYREKFLINELLSETAKISSFKDICNLTADRVIKVMGYQGVHVYDVSDGQLKAASVGDSQNSVLKLQDRQYTNRFAQQIISHVAERKSEIIDKMYLHQLFQLTHDDKNSQSQLSMSQSQLSMLITPVVFGENVRCAIVVFAKKTELKDIDRKLMHTVSANLSVALNNSILYETLENKVKEKTKKLERALEQLQLAQAHLVESEKHASLSTLVSGIAHEINTPIGNVIGVGSKINADSKRLKDLFNEDDVSYEEMEEYLEKTIETSNILVRELTRAADLIRRFKSVSVTQTNDKEQTFNIKDCLLDNVESIRPRLKQLCHELSINVALEVDCKGGKNIDSYPGAISQIIQNLIFNAYNHAFQTKRVGFVCIRLTVEDEEVCIQIEDNGDGMSAEVKAKIFDPFFTTKPGFGGTGLGLHIVYNIVTHLLKGKIHCVSETGQGSKMQVCFPA